MLIGTSAVCVVPMWKEYQRATLVKDDFADVALFYLKMTGKGCDRMGHTDYVHMDVRVSSEKMTYIF